MTHLEELQSLYEKASQEEDEYRRMVFVPASNQLQDLLAAKRAIWEEMDEIKLSYFKKDAGDFISADLSKLDMEWFLSAHDMGEASNRYRDEVFEQLPIDQAYHYNPETGQIVLSVRVSPRADIADIEEIALWIEKLLPYLKPFHQYKYYFDVMEDGCSEYENIILYSQDGKHWCVKDDYGSLSNKDEGSLRTMLEYLRAYYPYS